MDKKQAIAELKKLYGENAAYRRNEKAVIGEEREALRASLSALNAAEKEAIRLRDARREELLKDPEYVRLSQEAKAAVQKRQDAASRIYTRRVTIGKILSGNIFLQTADGDNWAEAINKAKERA